MVWQGVACALYKIHRLGHGGADLLLPVPTPALWAGGGGAWPWFAGWMWLLTMVVYPEEHRGFPRVASGSWVLQSPSSKGFVLLSISVSP